MTTHEKRIDYVDVGVKALRARWRIVRPLMIEAADAYLDYPEIHAQYLRDVKSMGKWVHAVRRAKFDPSIEVLNASLDIAERSLEEGFRDLEMLEENARRVLARPRDRDAASERDPVKAASERHSADEQAEEDREIIDRVFPPPCSLCERVTTDLVSWDT
jgi:hypothetical protein